MMSFAMWSRFQQKTTLYLDVSFLIMIKIIICRRDLNFENIEILFLFDFYLLLRTSLKAALSSGI